MQYTYFTSLGLFISYLLAINAVADTTLPVSADVTTKPGAEVARLTYTPSKGLVFKTQDDRFKFKLGATLQFDAAVYADDKTPLEDGIESRRARLSLGGTLYKHWDFKGTLDFRDLREDTLGPEDVLNAYVRYSGLPPFRLTVGQHKEPLSLEWQTSSEALTFMERALPTVFIPSYHLGLSLDTYGDRWTAAAGVFGGNLAEDEEGWGVSGRLTFSPFYQKTHSIHLGMAGTYRVPEQETASVRFRVRPESRITDVRFVDTDDIGRVDDHRLLGLEMAGVLGPFSMQGEYLRAFVNRQTGRPNVTFDGWYIFGSWFLTGESRRYQADKGEFDDMKPRRNVDFHGGLGAWEVGVRYSQLDLSDESIRGGEERNVTLGLNWYLNQNMRLMANYIWANTHNSREAGRARGEHEHPSLWQFRVAIHF